MQTECPPPPTTNPTPLRIWVITPSLNQAAYLRQTIDSVRSQAGGVDLRHVVVDGGSVDGTVALLRTSTDSRLWWSSGPDGGQSDAVNKGLNQVDVADPGNDGVIGWLNSDDLYLPGAAAAVAAAFENPAVQWVVGGYRVIDDAGASVRQSVVRYKRRRLDRYTYRHLLRENFIPQPAVFWRRSFGDRVGRLDPSLHYTMDYDLWLRMGRAAPPTVLGRDLAAFRVHPASKTGRINRTQFDEGYAVAARYFGDDRASRLAHRLNVEKIVWAYRLMQRFGR